jgi:magnesium-transporting ATPase (P-type)
MYYDDNRKATTKVPFNPENDNQYTSDGQVPNPFLLSNSLVASGSGTAVVCCVGANSRRGLKEEKLDTNSKTPLQTKLENLGGHFTKWGLYAAIAILLALVTNFIIKVAAAESFRTPGKIMKAVGEFFTISIAVIVVAVPEGLPLTITLSLAYSVMRMKKDGILVRNLDSPEVMGRVDEIVTGKTGTMTKAEMKVD